MSMRITIDPGHTKGSNHSPYVSKYYEGTQMFYLAQKLKAELEKRGFEVFVTREKVTDDPSLAERGSMAGKNGCCMFLSLHSNAPGQATAEDGSKYYPENCTGTVVYYSMTRSENLDLADRLGKKVSELMGHYYRGSKTREYPNKPGVDYYGVIRNAAQSGCSCAMLIEHGFHTHKADAEYLLIDENLQKLAEAEADIIAEYFAAYPSKESTGEIAVGSVVKIKEGAVYWSGKNIPAWVMAKNWLVECIASTGRAVINKSEDGKSAIMSPIDVKYLTLAYPPTPKDTPEEGEAPAAEPEAPKQAEETEVTVTIRRRGDSFEIVGREKLAELLK